ncbi:mce associated protein mas1a [Rhodococcus sp. NPDC003318]|uniref:mce associated protein mas1a n=1 Tax=Rhodococcus sp. NPDC003318 TaxID=3364503 RepID=UPI0036B5DDAC
MATDDTTTAVIGRGTDTPEVSPTRAGSRFRQPRVLIAIVLIVALLASAVGLLIAVLNAREKDSLRDQAIETARTYSVEMSSFDFENLDANRDAIVAQSTPEFADKYSEMVDALRQIVTDGKGKATAVAEHIGVESVDEDSAVVLVFVDQQATNVVSPDGNTQKYRMVVSLVRDGDRWVVDNVETK